MNDVLEVLFRILPVVIAVLWILRRIGRRVPGRSNRSAASRQTDGTGREPDRPTGIRSRRVREERERQADQQKSERKKTLEKVLARVAELTEGMPIEKRIPGEDELYNRMDHSWPGSPAPRQPGGAAGRTSSGDSHSLLVDLDEEEEKEVAAPRPPGRTAATPLERLSGLPPLAQGILWAEILGSPVGQKGPEEEFRRED